MKYVRITRRIFRMLSLRIRHGALMVFLLGVYAVLEGMGIGLLMPVLQYIELGMDAIPTGGVWSYLTWMSERLGIPLGLGTLLVLAFVPILARQGIFYLNTWYSANVQSAATARLMVRAFSSLTNAQISYIDSQDHGRLLAFVIGQVQRCGQALILYIRMLGALTIVVVYAILLAAISWRLALISMFALGGASFAVRKILANSRRYGAAVTQASVAITAAVRDRIAALRLVKMTASEDDEIAEVDRLATVARDANVRIAVASARVEVTVDPLLMMSLFVVIYIGIVTLGLSLAGLGLFMFILMRLNGKAKEINLNRQTLASVMPSFDYVETILGEAEGAVESRGGSRQFNGLVTGIEFDDVWFSYEVGGNQVLKGVTLSLPKGSMTALVGRSGSGKSTLVDMVPVLRVPTVGRVLFDGVSATEFDTSALRPRVGMLTQEPILFNDTIRSNLTYGLDDVPSDQTIHDALEASYCAEFVSELPQGIETNLGERGVRFSGGQRQRLALARVLLQNPDILILDEPTSALDSESEQYIQRALEALHGKVTLIVIAHRLSTVESADQIVVLSDGEVVEKGTHAELMENESGPYRRLFDMQIRA